MTNVKSVILLMIFVLGFTVIYFMAYNHFDTAVYNFLDLIRNFAIGLVAVIIIGLLFFKKYTGVLIGFFIIIVILVMPKLVKLWQERELTLIKQKVAVIVQNVDEYAVKYGRYPLSLTVLKNNKPDYNYYLGIYKGELFYDITGTAYSISFRFYKSTNHTYYSSNKQWKIED